MPHRAHQLLDPDVHDLWLSDVVDHYLVPGEAARTRLIGRDVDASSVTVTGFPVAAAFAELGTASTEADS